MALARCCQRQTNVTVQEKKVSWSLPLDKGHFITGGHGYMNEKNMPTSNIEEYWGGVIDDIPFVVALYFYDKEVSENHFIRYMSISEFRIRAEKVDEMKSLKRFQELILDYGLYMIKRELDDCYIVGIPKFKYVINL